MKKREQDVLNMTLSHEKRGTRCFKHYIVKCNRTTFNFEQMHYMKTLKHPYK